MSLQSTLECVVKCITVQYMGTIQKNTFIQCLIYHSPKDSYVIGQFLDPDKAKTGIPVS